MCVLLMDCLLWRIKSVNREFSVFINLDWNLMYPGDISANMNSYKPIVQLQTYKFFMFIFTHLWFHFSCIHAISSVFTQLCDPCTWCQFRTQSWYCWINNLFPVPKIKKSSETWKKKLPKSRTHVPQDEFNFYPNKEYE